MGSHWVQKMGQNRKKLPCPKIRIFDYRAVIDILQQMEDTAMALNHDGDPVGSILGPKGSHWVTKMGQNRKKLPCPIIWIYRLPRSHRFFAKNGSYSYGTKSRWGLPWVHHGANGVPLGPKIGQNRKNYHASKNWNIPLPCDHRFFPKNESYGYGAKLRWGLPRVHHGANGVPLGPKYGSKTQKKIPYPKIRVFDYPAVIDILQQSEDMVMALNHDGDPVGSI